MNIKPIRKLLLGIAVAGFWACSFSMFAFATDMDEYASALAKVDSDWSGAAAARDADKVASFYAEDAIAYPPNAPVANGRPAIKSVWSGYFSNNTFQISWKALHAEVATGHDLGYTAGTYEASFKNAEGKQASQQGKYVTVWEKQKDGTWMVLHDIWNADAP